MKFPKNTNIERIENTLMVGMTVDPSLVYFEGHFVGAPVLAGVAQIGWIVALLEREFDLKLAFKGMKLVKFTRLILPNTKLTIQLDYDPESCSVKFKITDKSTRCASGVLFFEAEG